MVQTEVTVKELPFDKVEYDNSDRVIVVTSYNFEGTKIVATVYREDTQFPSFFRNRFHSYREDKGKISNMWFGLEKGDLPDKVRQIFNAENREGIASLVETGELTRVG